jgi:prepilin-type N-terminal cleavage/methylation domain-containing protein
MKQAKNKGFTLIEVLVVIGIIAILAAIVVIAVNPARQFAQANNSQRWSNVNAVLNAVHQYAVQTRGQIPAGITNTPTEICKSTVASTTCATNGLVHLGDGVLVPTYVVGIPTDPITASTNGTGYRIATTTGNRIKVTAPGAELEAIIEVER